MTRPGATALAVALLLVGCGHDDGDTAAPGTSECRPAQPERVVPTPLQVENLLEPGPRASMDTDGDGHRDTVAVEGGAVVVTGADGALRLAEAGHDVALQAWGDFDGDGRDDLVIADTDVSPGTTAVYLVQGVTAPGTHAPAAAGVRVGDQVTYPWLQDLDGRPGADLVVPVRHDQGSHTDVYSGAALLALGPGGDGRGTAPVRRLEGLTRGVAPLAPGADPETILLVPGPRPAVRFASRPAALFEAPFDPSHRVEDIVVFDQDGVRKVALQVDDRVAVWAVPPACRG